MNTQNVNVARFARNVESFLNTVMKLSKVTKLWIFDVFQVNMLNAVTANFLGDNLQCWMQIQSGKGPWSSEVSGIVKIGQTMTMVLGIKDEENKFDMVVSSKS